MKEVAGRLYVAPGVVYYWINRGILTAKKVAPRWLWDIQLDESKELELQERVRASVRLKKANSQ